MEELKALVHAIDATRKTVDGTSGKLWWYSYASTQNINSLSSGAAKGVGKII
jgi:glyceraldehyde 3-phosphate dehydrogenase